MKDQITIFDELYPKYKITKPIRLIEMFSGYGSQALALKYLGVKFEHWKICEWAIKSIQAYKDIHFNDVNIDCTSGYSKEALIDWLFEKGISSNYNEPMTKEQISRLNENSLRNIFNNIIMTNNLVNVQKVKGKDLEIVDKDEYEYILTYSFPCQDLSVAGRCRGMNDTSTRSGMLWEVERILTECHELDSLPQILIMENVPQVHGADNVKDFNKWQLRLEELGYKNYWEDLIATDYGIPQTRNRTFMISILGDYSYVFPKSIPLKLKLKDMLEDNVKEKYYLSDKMKKYIFSEDDKYKVNKNSLKLNRDIAVSKTTREGTTRADASDYLSKNLNIVGYIPQWYQRGHIYDENGSMTTICATDYKTPKLVKINEKKSMLKGGKQLNETIEKNIDKFKKGQILNLDLYNRSVSEHLSMTITLPNHNSQRLFDGLKIRKLTPKECFRLQGVKDEDYEKCAINQSDSSLYHLAGDSIVVNVLMAIFKELL